jgi:type IV secretory pathway TrbD component
VKKFALIVGLLAAVVVIATQTDVLASSGIMEMWMDPEPCVCGR